MPLVMRILITRKYKVSKWSNILKILFYRPFRSYILSSTIYIYFLFESSISKTIYHIYIILMGTSFEAIIIYLKHTELIQKGNSIDSNVIVITPCGVKQWIFPMNLGVTIKYCIEYILLTCYILKLQVLLILTSLYKISRNKEYIQWCCM